MIVVSWKYREKAIVMTLEPYAKALDGNWDSPRDYSIEKGIPFLVLCGLTGRVILYFDHCRGIPCM